MAIIHPIPAITYDTSSETDMLPVIAPPYDVLDEESKAELLSRNDRNIVAIDLPHLPAKTVGPDETYEQAGETFRQWLKDGDLIRRDKSALFAYQQTYTVNGTTYRRKGLFANLRIQDFGPASDGKGGIYPHEQTFGGPKEDRLKLMRATRAQLSPIFGLFSDSDETVGQQLEAVVTSRDNSYFGTTTNDSVLHEVWAIDDADECKQFQQLLESSDVFIADGHHRYNTALNYKKELIKQQFESEGELPADHPANYCLFVLVAMQDPGMIVLPTHRVLGGMKDFSLESFTQAAEGKLEIQPFDGADIDALEKALPDHGDHAMGIVTKNADGSNTLSIASTTIADPLAATHGEHVEAWRQLDVAVLQHMIVEQICEPNFCEAEQKVTWKFPHSNEQALANLAADTHQVAFVMQATPLDSVRLVSEAGELMPQKSTFFYPKVATGLVINPLA